MINMGTNGKKNKEEKYYGINKNVVIFLVFSNCVNKTFVRNGKCMGDGEKKRNDILIFPLFWQHNIFAWTFAILFWNFFSAVFQPTSRSMLEHMTKEWTAVGKRDFTADNIQIIHIYRLIWHTVFSFRCRATRCFCCGCYANNDSNGKKKYCYSNINACLRCVSYGFTK